MIYLISYGEYGNYITAGYVEHSLELNIDDLWSSFLEKTGITNANPDMGITDYGENYPMGDANKLQRHWSEKYGLSKYDSRYDCRDHASLLDIFKEWLIREQGFTRVVLEEWNIAKGQK